MLETHIRDIVGCAEAEEFLRRSPGLAAVAILTVALGVGASTTLCHAILLCQGRSLKGSTT